MIADDDLTPKPAGVETGRDLSMLSLEELEERVAAFEAEIARLKAEIAAKRSSRQAADQFFRL